MRAHPNPIYVGSARRVYDAILSGARWARRIRGMANEALDHALPGIVAPKFS